ncbi:MAG: hypothetical protein IT472_02420 [Thermomonas sp.]|uniref:hypothetical protein n=1 Tax=Thermomonas sp. TaxID=1971895 RepID=UPI00262F132F|nr:hypothetical protein [Thermomonas sp.]MCC7096022.1 hypothetical protein [Thermomonas sp.]
MRILQRAVLIASCLLVACRPSPQAASPSTAQPTPSATAAPVAAATPSAPVVDQADWTLPGWITPQTTLAQLQARYGAGNVRKETLTGPEGMTYDAYVLFADDPTRRLELDLFNDSGVDRIAGIRIVDTGTRWHDANGLHTGMTLEDLVAKNGKPISFSGLDWDYGGTIQDWHGGTLAPTDPLTTYPTIILTRRTGLGESVALPAGDGLFRSDDPKWPNVGKDLVVGQVLMSWPDEND